RATRRTIGFGKLNPVGCWNTRLAKEREWIYAQFDLVDIKTKVATYHILFINDNRKFLLNQGPRKTTCIRIIEHIHIGNTSIGENAGGNVLKDKILISGNGYVVRGFESGSRGTVNSILEGKIVGIFLIATSTGTLRATGSSKG